MTPAEIKQARLTLGLTQDELGAWLGYSPGPRVSELECGVKRPSGAVVTLLRLYLAGIKPPSSSATARKA